MNKPVNLIAVFTILFSSAAALQADPAAGFGMLFYRGDVVRTVVPPAAMTKPGTDDFFVVRAGADGQMPVIAVAPGDRGYRGGKWAFHFVDWTVAPYLLTSEMAVLMAEMAGDVVITRVPEMDFKCPVQP